MLFTAVEKSRKRSGFVICSYFIDSVLQRYVKRVHLSIEGIGKGCLRKR